MASLDPTLQSGPGFERPVVDNSMQTIVGAASDLFSALTPQKSETSFTEKKFGYENEALGSLSRELNQIQTGGFNQTQKNRLANQAVTSFLVEHPTLATEARSLTKEMTGIKEQEVRPTMADPEDALVSGFNKWLEDPMNVARTVGVRVMNRDGTYNEEASHNAALQAFYADQSRAAQVADAQRELNMLDIGDKSYEVKARNTIRSILPGQREMSEKIVHNLVGMVSIGDASVDTVPEQLAYLRNMRAQAKSRYASEYGGLPSNLYEKELQDALEPFDTLIQTATDLQEDLPRMLEAFRSATDLQVSEAFLKAFTFADRNLQKAIMETFIRQNLGDKVDDFMKEIDSLVAEGRDVVSDYTRFIQPFSMPTIGVVGADNNGSVNPPALSRTEPRTTQEIDSAIAAVSQGLPKGETEDQRAAVALLWGDITVNAAAKPLPLGDGRLATVFSNSNINALRETISAGGVRGEDLKTSVLSFIEQQQFKNKSIVDDRFSGMIEGSGPSKRFDVFLTSQGWQLHNLSASGQWRPVPPDSFGVMSEVRDSLAAMNRLLRVGNIITGGEYSKEFFERATEYQMPAPTPERKPSEFKRPNLIQGGGGDTQVEGRAGQDTLVQPPALLDLIDRTEGGAAYDTLYGFSNRSGPFAGVDVSRMTLREAIEFSNPSGAYGQWVKNKIGRVATPMGRFQIVGTTLRSAVREMGLSLDDPFDERTQNAIFAHLADRRLAGKTTMAEKRTALRAEWEGFKKVSDAELDAAIQDYEQNGAPLFSSRPETRSERGQESVPMASATSLPEDTEMASQPASPSVSAPILTDQGVEPTGRKAIRDEGRVDVLRDQTKKMLTRLGVNEEEVPRFNSEEEARDSGLPDDSIVIVNGEVMIL